MQHPFDGIAGAESSSTTDRPTRRTALERMVVAAAGLVGLQASANASTKALGEEGGNFETTRRECEEGGLGNPATSKGGEDGLATTKAEGEEGGISTRAIGEEGGMTRARQEDGLNHIADQLRPHRGSPPEPTVDLTRAQLDEAWNNLISTDGDIAAQAFQLLCVGKQSGDYLKERIKAMMVVADAARIDRLIADLDSNHFNVRQRATEELEKLSLAAEPALQKALASNPSLEMMRRVDTIITRGRGACQQAKQGIEILLVTRTIDALTLVTTLAGGPSGWLAEYAKGRIEQIRHLCWAQPNGGNLPQDQLRQLLMPVKPG
ncbi:MAG: hypothetical protein K2R98_30795 [Gemmataceae bacterium]|nr:hypothetical protein [Gemmataceae bacterium]